MAIIIGADGGPLGGPLKALEAAGEALATNHALQTQAREEQRQNRFDVQREAEQSQLMRLRNSDELRRQREMTLREAENKRQEADAEYIAQRRATEQNERVAAKTGAASRLKAMLGGDHSSDPAFMGPDATTDEQRAVRLGVPVETLREYDELAAQAPNLSPDEYRSAADDIARRAQGLIYTRRKQNVLGLLNALASPQMSADGQQGDPIIDKKRAQDLMQALEQGASPDQVEGVLSSTLRSHAQRQAATQINTIRTQGLGQYLMDIQAAGDNPQVNGQTAVDPEDLADALSIQKQMEAIAGLATPTEIATMEREARRIVSGGRTKGGSPKELTYKYKPQEQWTPDDWYDRDIDNAAKLKYTGREAEQYVERARAWRESHGAAASGAPQAQATVDPNAPMPQQAGAQPAQAAPQAGATPQAGPAVDPFTKDGSPSERVAAAAAELVSARAAGEMMSQEEIKAFLLAAKEGNPRPERKTDRRGKPLTKGQVQPLMKGAKASDTQRETDRLQQMLDR